MMASVRRRLHRFIIGLLGGIVLVVGVIAIPYPGPGWLIVFAGLGILATEYDWAKRLLAYAREKYDGWQAWVKRQPFALKLTIAAVTAVIVILTIWLLNGYGFLGHLLHFNQPWLDSPLALFH